MALRFLTAGESHGKALVGILEGMPKGVRVEKIDFELLMKKRWAGYGRGPRRTIETDVVEVLSGIRYGYTLGSPISLFLENLDFSAWETLMNPYSGGMQPAKKLTAPRSGHADLAGAQKYGTDDLRDILERASARETAIRTALSVPARNLLKELGFQSLAYVTQIGGIPADLSSFSSFDQMEKAILQAEEGFPTPDRHVVSSWRSSIDKAKAAGDTLGGSIEVRVKGVPPGLGSHVHWDRRLDSRFSSALMSIPGVKAVEIGEGIGISGLPGSKAHDCMKFSKKRGYFRTSNLAGGLEGGITNGEELRFRCFMKPIPTRKTGQTIALKTHEAIPANSERSDTVAAAALAIIAESVLAIELASAALEKFGGDTLEDVLQAYAFYRKRLKRL